MAKVYAPPPGVAVPKFSREAVFDYQGAVNEYIEALAVMARQQCKHELAGEVANFPIADGTASYMIWSVKPFQLLHLPLWDAYALPAAHERGLTLADVRLMVGRQAFLRNWFAEAP